MGMRGRWAGFVVLVVLAVVVFVGGPAALQVVHVHWPAWLVAAVLAVAAAAVAVGKPAVTAISQAMGQRPASRIQRAGRRQDLLESVPGPGSSLPRVSDVLSRGTVGIHPAIPLPEDSDPALSAELPTYVQRDIDATLRTWLAAHAKTGGFALIVGPAAAGKTRCAYEAVKAEVSDWWFLLPPTGRYLIDLVDAGSVPARTVVWLNDIDSYLGPDRLTASVVRRLLANTRSPVLLIGTIWPKRLETLTGDPFPRPSNEKPEEEFDASWVGDLRADARDILAIQAECFRLEPTFSSEELCRAQLIDRKSVV